MEIINKLKIFIFAGFLISVTTWSPTSNAMSNNLNYACPIDNGKLFVNIEVFEISFQSDNKDQSLLKYETLLVESIPNCAMCVGITFYDMSQPSIIYFIDYQPSNELGLLLDLYYLDEKDTKQVIMTDLSCVPY